MKIYILLSILIFTTVIASAIPFTYFSSWNDLIEQSPDILIVKCTDTLDLDTPESDTQSEHKVLKFSDDVIHSDINIISVLKGNAKPGPSRMASWYWPHKGEKFLMFASYGNARQSVGFSAIETYRIVPLSREFDLRKLDGKSLREQVQIILDNRLADLKDEIARDTAEQNRIEITNNSPPSFQLPPKGMPGHF